MDFFERLSVAVKVFTSEAPEPPDNVTRMPRSRRRASSEDVGGWMESADNRGDPIFEEMDRLLHELHLKWPIRARRIQRELAWLRREAYKAGLSWGVKGKWWQV